MIHSNSSQPRRALINLNKPSAIPFQRCETLNMLSPTLMNQPWALNNAGPWRATFAAFATKSVQFLFVLFINSENNELLLVSLLGTRQDNELSCHICFKLEFIVLILHNTSQICLSPMGFAFSLFYMLKHECIIKSNGISAFQLKVGFVYPMAWGWKP